MELQKAETTHDKVGSKHQMKLSSIESTVIALVRLENGAGEWGAAQ
jgi:hypothetical protein